MAVEADVYRDYHIPKGAIIIPNIWCDLCSLPLFKLISGHPRAITQNPEFYPNPDRFLPERFMGKDVPDPREAVFGFGRR